MARYRKVSVQIWNDEKFRDLSDDGQLVFLFLLTHPYMTSLGAMRHTLAGLAEEKGWTPQRFSKGYGEPFRKGMVKHDERACFIWLPNFLKHNPPENPNVVKSWSSALELLPECEMKVLMVQQVRDFIGTLPEGYAKALPEPFRKGMPKGMPNQEQEQEQEQEQQQEQEQEQLQDAREPCEQNATHPGEEGEIAVLRWEDCCTALRTAFAENPTVEAFRRWLSGRMLGMDADAAQRALRLVLDLIARSRDKNKPAAWFIGAVKQSPHEGGFGWRPERARSAEKLAGIMGHGA